MLFHDFGAFDPSVWTAQAGLAALGYSVGGSGTDGLWGPATAAAASAFRNDAWLPDAGSSDQAALLDLPFNVALGLALSTAGVVLPSPPSSGVAASTATSVPPALLDAGGLRPPSDSLTAMIIPILAIGAGLAMVFGKGKGR
jgi:peptidoglycan hydrolase-like protein with peptidoglycan-binding domain